MFSNLGILRDTATSYCTTDTSNHPHAKTPACPMSSLATIAMNFITAVSATKSLVSGNTEAQVIDGPKVDEPNSTTNAAPGPLPASPPSLTDPTWHSQSPKARSRRRSSLGRTSYCLAHPASSAKHRHRFRIRSKTILQLRQTPNTSQPSPVIDVLPSIMFAPRLARKVPQIFQGKQGLSLGDLLIVRSQNQDLDHTALPQEQGSQGIEDEGLNDREVLAAICQLKQKNTNGPCRTELRFNRGSSWTAIALRSGAYEFVSRETVGTLQSIARWVPRREADMGGSTTSKKTGSEAFKFSLVDPTTRRHPVIANMSKKSIDIFDRYSMPAPLQMAHQPTDADSVETATLQDHTGADDGECEEPQKTMIETDDHLRILIAVSGIWVTLCEGWSPNFRYGTKQVISNGISEVSNRRRSNTVNVLPPILDQGDHRYHEAGSILQSRPGFIHTSSLSSVPTSPFIGSPATSPGRVASSSMSAFRSEVPEHPSPIKEDHRLSSTCVQPVNDVEHDIAQQVGARKDVLKLAPDTDKGAKEQLPAIADARRRSGQDLVSEATLVEERLEKSSRLRRLASRLRRTKTCC